MCITINFFLKRHGIMRKMNFFLIESSIMAVFYMHTWKQNVI